MPASTVIQYIHLENLGAGLRPQDEVHVTVLEQSRLEHSALAQSNIKIGIHVRLVDGRGHIVSWRRLTRSSSTATIRAPGRPANLATRMPGRWPKRSGRPSAITCAATPKKTAPPARRAS
jgi:hypothetical protein